MARRHNSNQALELLCLLKTEYRVEMANMKTEWQNLTYFARVHDLIYSRWDEVPTRKLAGFLAGIGVFALLLFNSEPGFVFGLDHANLLFHEAGHPAVGAFQLKRLETYVEARWGSLSFQWCWRFRSGASARLSPLPPRSSGFLRIG